MSRTAGLASALAVMTLIAGCAASPSPKFYALSAVAMNVPPSDSRGMTVSIGPVTVPELVDQPKMVIMLDANRVSIDEYARWAEPLKRGIARVLVADLTQSLLGAIVTAYPQRVDDDAYRVSVDVQEFASSASGMTTLSVIWSVRAGEREEPVRGRSVVHETAAGPGNDALVNAYSRSLARVATDIAAALRGANWEGRQSVKTPGRPLHRAINAEDAPTPSSTRFRNN